MDEPPANTKTSDRGESTARQPQSVRLVVAAPPLHSVRMEPAISEVTAILRYERRRYQVADLCADSTVVEVPVYRYDDSGGLIFPAGLLSRVKVWLREHGHSVSVLNGADHHPNDVDPFQGVLPGQSGSALLDAIANNRLGLIETRTPGEKLDHIVAIAKAFSAARIVVAMSTPKRARALCLALTARLAEKVGMFTGRVRDNTSRIVVSTYSHLPIHRRWSVVLLHDVKSATEMEAPLHIWKLAFRRLYAFVDPCRQLERSQAFLLETIAGTVILPVMPA